MQLPAIDPNEFQPVSRVAWARGMASAHSLASLQRRKESRLRAYQRVPLERSTVFTGVTGSYSDLGTGYRQGGFNNGVCLPSKCWVYSRGCGWICCMHVERKQHQFVRGPALPRLNVATFSSSPSLSLYRFVSVASSSSSVLRLFQLRFWRRLYGKSSALQGVFWHKSSLAPPWKIE